MINNSSKSREMNKNMNKVNKPRNKATKFIWIGAACSLLLASVATVASFWFWKKNHPDEKKLIIPSTTQELYIDVSPYLLMTGTEHDIFKISCNGADYVNVSCVKNTIIYGNEDSEEQNIHEYVDFNKEHINFFHQPDTDDFYLDLTSFVFPLHKDYETTYYFTFEAYRKWDNSNVTANSYLCYFPHESITENMVIAIDTLDRIMTFEFDSDTLNTFKNGKHYVYGEEEEEEVCWNDIKDIICYIYFDNKTYPFIPSILSADSDSTTPVLPSLSNLRSLEAITLPCSLKLILPYDFCANDASLVKITSSSITKSGSSFIEQHSNIEQIAERNEEQTTFETLKTTKTTLTMEAEESEYAEPEDPNDSEIAQDSFCSNTTALERIDTAMFRNLKKLPNNFFAFSNLHSFDFSNLTKLEEIGNNVFYDSNIKKIEINSPKLKKIGDNFLYESSFLGSLTFCEEIKLISIGNNFASQCHSLHSITIPSFDLQNSENLPTKIGHKFLYNDYSLSNIKAHYAAGFLNSLYYGKQANFWDVNYFGDYFMYNVSPRAFAISFESFKGKINNDGTITENNGIVPRMMLASSRIIFMLWFQHVETWKSFPCSYQPFSNLSFLTYIILEHTKLNDFSNSFTASETPNNSMYEAFSNNTLKTNPNSTAIIFDDDVTLASYDSQYYYVSGFAQKFNNLKNWIAIPYLQPFTPDTSSQTSYSSSIRNINKHSEEEKV